MTTASILGGGRTLVSAAGTAVQLSSTATETNWIKVQAISTNTNAVWVGGSGVKNDNTGGGMRLTAGEAIPLEVDNLNKVYVDATTNNEGVIYLYGR